MAVVANYLLFYEINESFIYILSVYDGRRNPKDLVIR